MALSTKREQLIEAAVELFSREGFHAVGIDAIAKKAGITKKTLYYHFKSKEELILAVLRHYDERFRNTFMRSVEGKTDDPAQRLMAVFDVAADWFNQKNFYGCMFVRALGEFPEPDTPVRNICMESKRLMRNYIETLAKAAKLESPEMVSGQLFLLLEGAITLAQVNANSRNANEAKSAANILIQNARSNLKN